MCPLFAVGKSVSSVIPYSSITSNAGAILQVTLCNNEYQFNGMPSSHKT